MKPKEALDWCERLIDNLVLSNVDTKKRTLGLQAMQTCKSALEKQIPKKPQIYNTFERHCECGAIVKSYCNYCPCGQALDWGDCE